MDGEEIGIPEGIEENNNEGDASELLMPMDRPAPVVMDVDDDSTESGASVEEEISMENDQDNIDAGGNLVVTDGEDSDDIEPLNEGEEELLEHSNDVGTPLKMQPLIWRTSTVMIVKIITMQITRIARIQVEWQIVTLRG